MSPPNPASPQHRPSVGTTGAHLVLSKQLLLPQRIPVPEILMWIINSASHPPASARQHLTKTLTQEEEK